MNTRDLSTGSRCVARLPALRGQRGFTLFEVLVAAMVLGLAFTSATWAMSATARTKALHAGNSSQALRVAKELYELAQGLPTEPSGVTGATSGAELLALDSLIGAQFSPPLRADGSADPDLVGWSQQTELSVIAVDAPATPLGDAPGGGLPVDAQKLYRLSVRVLQGDVELGTFDWWITP